MMTKEMGETIMDDLHKGVISSQEVADRFGTVIVVVEKLIFVCVFPRSNQIRCFFTAVAVKQRLGKDDEELKRYKSKVQHLQNQMIKVLSDLTSARCF